MPFSPKMKRNLIIGLAVAVLLPVGLACVIVLRLGTVIKAGFEIAGPRMMGVETRLDDASVSLVRGHVDLSGMHVGNPEGFEIPQFLKADLVHVSADTLSFFRKEVHVRRILLERPEFTYEVRDG